MGIDDNLRTLQGVAAGADLTPAGRAGPPVGPHPNTPVDLPFFHSLRELAALSGPEAVERLELIRREYAASVLRLLSVAYADAANLIAVKPTIVGR